MLCGGHFFSIQNVRHEIVTPRFIEQLKNWAEVIRYQHQLALVLQIPSRSLVNFSSNKLVWPRLSIDWTLHKQNANVFLSTQEWLKVSVSLQTTASCHHWLPPGKKKMRFFRWFRWSKKNGREKDYFEVKKWNFFIYLGWSAWGA